MINNYKTVFSDKKQLSENVFLLNFKLLEPADINFVAGQYLILKVPKDNAFLPRLYSIASGPSKKNEFDLIVELVPNGLASEYIKSFKIGQEVSFTGPAGQFTVKENAKNKVFLITGTGIAPVRAILQDVKHSESGVDVFWGLKNYQDVYLFDEFKDFEFQIPNFRLHICLSRETKLDKIDESVVKYFDIGHVDSCFDKLLNDGYQLSSADYYLCGRREVVESLKNYLLSKKVPLADIHFEKF